MNHQYASRSQKSKKIKATHVLLVILLLVMGAWSLFQIKHSGYNLLVKKLQDGSLGRKGLVEPIDGNVIIEITNEAESRSRDDDDKGPEESQAEELYKQLFESVDNSTEVLSSDSGEDSIEDADEANLVSEKSEGPNGDDGFQDENGIPPGGHPSEMFASYKPRSGGLSMDDEIGSDSGHKTEVTTNTTKTLEESDIPIETNGPGEKEDESDKEMKVDTNYDENMEPQR